MHSINNNVVDSAERIMIYGRFAVSVVVINSYFLMLLAHEEEEEEEELFKHRTDRREIMFQCD